MTDYTLAACLNIDAAEFDKEGTPIAWAACERCPIRSECLTDAEAESTISVYRGGHAFPDYFHGPRTKANHDRANVSTVCRVCSVVMAPRSRRFVKSGLILHYGRGLCEKCYRRHRKAGTLDDFERVVFSAAELLSQWELLRLDGYTREQAAARMGISRGRLEKAIQRADKKVVA